MLGAVVRVKARSMDRTHGNADGKGGEIVQ